MKNGVSIIILAITVMVLAILLSVTMSSYYNSSDSLYKSNVAQELYIVTSKIEEYYLFNKKYPYLVDVSGNALEVILTVSELNQSFQDDLIRENIQGGTVSLKEIDLEKVDVLDLIRGYKDNGNDDVFLYSEDTGYIYYMAGYCLKDGYYYSLNDELQGFININKIN